MLTNNLYNLYFATKTSMTIFPKSLNNWKPSVCSWSQSRWHRSVDQCSKFLEEILENQLPACIQWSTSPPPQSTVEVGFFLPWMAANCASSIYLKMCIRRGEGNSSTCQRQLGSRSSMKSWPFGLDLCLGSFDSGYHKRGSHCLENFIILCSCFIYNNSKSILHSLVICDHTNSKHCSSFKKW